MDMRSIYCPAHLGNFYECAARTEMADLYREWKSWGINEIGTCFNPVFAVDPFGKDPLLIWARDQSLKTWERKRDLLLAAQELGLGVNCGFVPNAVYVDQLKPELAATVRETHTQGPHICPSIPEGLDIVRANFENTLKYLKDGGVRLDRIFAGFRDWGGCDCDRCTPWIGTSLRIWQETLSPVLQRLYPGAGVQFGTWWVGEGEMGSFRELFDRKPSWFEGINLSLGYTEDIPDFDVPPPFWKTIFLHISYATSQEDKYGRKGAVAAPARLGRIFRKLAGHGIRGFHAYSEGIYEDLNKYLVARLGENADQDTQDLTAEYCERYFRTRGKDTGALVSVIQGMETLEENCSGAGKMQRLLRPIERQYGLEANWRFRVFAVRAEVGRLEHAIGNRERWEEESRGMMGAGREAYIRKIQKWVDRRHEVLDDLERYVYRIGNQCFVLHIPKKYEDWTAFCQSSRTGRRSERKDRFEARARGKFRA